jgi:hypothetical protein
MNKSWRYWSSIFVIRRLSLKEKEYPTLPLADDHDEQIEPLIDDIRQTAGPKSHKSRGGRCSQLFLMSCPLLMVLVLTFLTLATTIVAMWVYRPKVLQNSHPVSQIMVKPCGESPGEARRNGCHFDIISFCWLAPECYDAELSQDFDDANKLEWFLDPNRTQSLTREQIMTGEYTGLYVNWEYHLRHCTAMWKKLHRAVLRNIGRRAIDGYIGSYEHTKHCEHMLLGDRDIALATINTRIAVKYPDCGI